MLVNVAGRSVDDYVCIIRSLDAVTDDRIDVVTRGMLGLTVACARCHDHKFDPIPQADYYALYGIFSSTVFPPVLGPEMSSVRSFGSSVRSNGTTVMFCATRSGCRPPRIVKPCDASLNSIVPHLKAFANRARA